MVTTRWGLEFQKRPERPTSARLPRAFPWVIYWIYLRQQAQGVTAQSKRSKTIYEIQDGGHGGGVPLSRTPFRCRLVCGGRHG